MLCLPRRRVSLAFQSERTWDSLKMRPIQRSCSSLPICALGLMLGGSGVGGVSQVINMVYHSPARL